jgi:hypothetical protein
MELIMDEKMKRKGTPRPLYVKLGYSLLLAMLLGVGLLTLLIVQDMNATDATQLAIAPVDAAIVPTVEYLSQLPQAVPISQTAAAYLEGAFMINGDDYYLCLTIPEGVVLSIDLAALNLQINDENVAYTANTNAPLNCILLDATLSSGWYIVELQTLDSTSRQPTANYIWGIQVP